MATQRLPIPGSDDGTWGNILNGFLEVSHNPDGTLIPSALSTAGGELTTNKNQPSGYAGLNSSGFIPVALLPANIPLSDLAVTGAASSSTYLRGDGTWNTPNAGSSSLAADSDVAIVSPANNQVLTYNSGASKWENLTPPASLPPSGSAGGDLTGTYPNPTLTGSANVESIITANTTVAGALQKTGGTMSGAIAMGSNKITGLTNGSNPQDAAAYGQIPTSLPPNGTAGGDLTGTFPNPTLTGSTNVESIITANTTVAGALQKTNNLSDVTDAGSSRANLHVPALTPAAAVSTSNVTSLSTTTTTVDGYSLATGDLVLLTAQSTGSQNGLWQVPASGNWTRPTEFATGATIKGRTILVMKGTTNANTQWALDTPTAGITIDTTAQSWSSVGVPTGTFAPTAGQISAGESVFNLPTNGTSDAAPALTAFLAACASAGSDGYIPAGTYNCISEGLTWNAAAHSIYAVGKVIITFANGTFSGPAWTETGTNGVSSVVTPWEHECQGIVFLGPNTDGGTIDGVYITDTTGVPGIINRNCRWNGFRDNFAAMGPNSYLPEFEHCQFTYGHRYNLNLTQGSSNSGENEKFIGCVINNAHNASVTGIGWYTPPTNDADIYFVGCSFDYNDQEFLHQGGFVSKLGGHMEDGNSALGAYSGGPMGQLKSTGGDQPATLVMSGMQISPTESAQSNVRDHLFEDAAGSTGKTTLIISNCNYTTYGWGGGPNAIYKNESGTSPVFRNIGLLPDPGPYQSTAAVLGQYVNRLVNGDFDSSSSFAASSSFPLRPGLQWADDGGSAPLAVFAFDTVHQQSGARCMSIIGAAGNANSQSLKQMTVCTPGEYLNGVWWINVPTYVSGSLILHISWYLDDDTTRTVANAIATINGATSGYTPYVGKILVPAGITRAYFDVQSASFVGTAYVDNCGIWGSAG
jgi:hypothetical protein